VQTLRNAFICSRDTTCRQMHEKAMIFKPLAVASNIKKFCNQVICLPHREEPVHVLKYLIMAEY
jgi:hypothetical protein